MRDDELIRLRRSERNTDSAEVPLSEIRVTGIGAVSAAGWGVEAFRKALDKPGDIAPVGLTRPGPDRTVRARKTPAPSPRPGFLAHTRLRRTSPIAHFAVGAALEALGDNQAAKFETAKEGARLGIVFCSMTGCVNYSNRFYGEVLNDPATASPLVFPETVYNSPSSHLAALLGTTEINYTLVGDPGVFVQGLALAADWLESRLVDACLVVGAEELDWLTAEATRLFDESVVVGDGAGALCLRRIDSQAAEVTSGCCVRLDAISDSYPFHSAQQKADAARGARSELRCAAEASQLLCDGLQDACRTDAAEREAWLDWAGPRMSVKRALGEAFAAAAAWQCVAAVDALRNGRYSAATASVVGCNQQAIAARFTR